MVEDAMMGPVILLRQAGRLVGVDLPPLNLPLAQALASLAPGDDRETLAETLVRVSQLVVDFPRIAALSLGGGEVKLRLHRDGDRLRLAIPPYPAELVGHFEARGETLLIRPIRPEDAQAHAELFRRLAPEDVRFRFFSTMREISSEQMARLTQVDYTREMAFVAVREATGETVGVSRLIHEPGEVGAEFAVLVEPAMKGKGLASHLMQRLFDWAAEAGIAEIFGLILADNAPMLSFVRRLGFRLRHLPEEPDVLEARR